MDEGTLLQAGLVHEWFKCPMKLIDLPTGFQINVVRDPVSGEFYGIDNVCAHKKANLALGDIEDLTSHDATGLCVRCPKHQNKFCGGLYFDLHTGKALTKKPCEHLDPTWQLATYKVVLEGEKVMVSMIPENGVDPLVPKGDKVVSAPFKITKITHYNHNTNIYEFTLGEVSKGSEKSDKKSIKCLVKAFKKAKVQYPLWHVDISSQSLFSKNTNGLISREYTPISSWDDFCRTNTMKVLIKLYAEGLMSQKLATSKEGDTLWFSIPHATVKVSLWPEVRKKKELCGCDGEVAPTKMHDAMPSYGFIAGGSGIAPAYQLIVQIIDMIARGKPAPSLTLLFSNRLRADTLLYDELKEFQEKSPNHIKCEFTLTGERVEGFRFGRINSEMIAEVLPRSRMDHVFVSGPAGMWESALSSLRANGYDEKECTELEA